MDYEHTQPGTLIRFLLGGFTVFFGGYLLFVWSRGDQSIWILTPILILGLLLPLFHSLTVTVDTNLIEVAFGIGIIRKRFFMEDVASVEATKSHWYNGWGIRLIHKGWLYNVSGYDVVQLNLRNGRVVQIGTNDPNGLLSAIETQLQRTSQPVSH